MKWKFQPNRLLDSEKISLDEYMQRGFEALDNWIDNNLDLDLLLREWEGFDGEGIHWRGFFNPDGTVKTMYPEVVK